MQWFDVGVNVPSDVSTLVPMLQRAVDVGVTQIMLTGTNITISQQAADLAHLYPEQVFSTAGIHPHYAELAPTDFIQKIRILAKQPQVVAIGECGLDFNRDFSPRDAQLAVSNNNLFSPVSWACRYFCTSATHLMRNTRYLKNIASS